VHRRVKNPIQLEEPQLRIVLIFVVSTPGYLDNGVYYMWGLRAWWKLIKIHPPASFEELKFSYIEAFSS